MRASLEQIRQKIVDEIYVLTIFEVGKGFTYATLQCHPRQMVFMDFGKGCTL